MKTFLFSLFSKVKLSQIMAIIILVLFLGLSHYRSESIKDKETAKIQIENFEQLLKMQKSTDSMQVVHLVFQKDTEIENYIVQNATLKSLLRKQGFNKSKDYDKINEMVLATQKYFDSLTHTFNATPLVENIKQDKNGIIEFSKKSECISYDGTLEYFNGDLTVNTFNEEYTGKVLLTKSKGRRTKRFLFFRYGPREDKFTATTNCGDVQIQVIERSKKP